MQHPTPTKPLTQALAKNRAFTTTLADFPELALAATNLNGEARALDTTSYEFGGVMATLETINRLKLGARNAHVLGLLISLGPTRSTDLAKPARLSTAGVSVILRRLEELALITTSRHKDNSDRREVIATATQAAHNVMASIVALSALGAAATVLFRKA